MRRKTRSVGVITVILLSGLAGFFVSESEHVSAYASHDPILIVGNENFTTANGVTGGNGTEADPYVIDGWEIINTTENLTMGIEIINTSAHFVIKNVSIELQQGEGIALDNVTNCTIEHVIISSSSTSWVWGISAGNCKNLKIRYVNTTVNKGGQISLGAVSNCIVENSNTSSTISLGSCKNVTLINNDIRLDYYMMIWDCNDITIVSNNFTDGDRIDIRNTENLTFHDNNMSQDVRFGIDVITTKNSNFTDNIVNSEAQCIWLEYSDNNRIENNYFNSPNYGVYLRYSSHNSILDNGIERGGMYFFQSTNNNISGNVLDGTSNGVVFATASNNIIRNNTLVNITDYAIELTTNSNDNEICRNNISGNLNGIYMSNSIDNVVIDNRIMNSDVGIELLPSGKSIKILNNTIMNNNYGIEVDGNMVASSINLTITGNRISSNSNRGIFLGYSTKNNIMQNIITDNGDGITFSGTTHSQIFDNNISNNNNYGIIFAWYSSYCTIENNAINHNAYDGISIVESHYSTIRNNTISWNGDNGAYIARASDNVIENNEFAFNEFNGLEVWESNDNTITNNTANNNNYTGLSVQESEGNLLKSNIVHSNNYYGMLLYGYYEAKVTGNEIYSNIRRGIQFTSCHNVDVFYNNVSGSDRGFNLVSTDKMNIYHNNFIDNYDNVNNGGETNTWNLDYPYGGNYWSDYSGEDIKCGPSQNLNGEDGIGDTPYSFSANTKDNYPLMKPFHLRKISGPQGLTAEVGIGYVNLSWNTPLITKNQDITNYIVYKGDQIDQINVLEEIGAVLFYNDTNVDPGEAYFYKVVARTDYELSDPSYIFKVMTVSEPGSPDTLNVTVARLSIFLDWSKPWSGSIYGEVPIINYKIYRATNEHPEYDLLAEPVNVRTYNDTDVVPGMEYFYKVTAVNAIGEGLPVYASAIVPLPPSMPTYLSAIADDDNIKLMWTWPDFDGGSEITEYKIYRSTMPGDEEFYVRLKHYNSAYYYDNDVIAGITYYYRISALNKFYESNLSNEASAVISTFPGIPINLNVKNAPNSLHLSWSPPLSDGGSDIINYMIYKGTRSNKIEFHKKIDNILYFNDMDVIDEITYYYQVRAVNAIGEGPLSERVGIKTVLAPNKEPVASIAVSNLTGKAPLTVDFTGTGSDADGTIISYHWDFDDGNTSTEQNPTHVFSREGTYYVKLTVLDDDNTPSIAMITIFVEPETLPPPEDEGDNKEKEGSLGWFIAPVAGIFVCIIILIILLFLWLKVKEDEPEVVERNRILREPIAYRRLKRKRSVGDENFLEEEMEE